jgi:hypothetical protein
MSEQCSRESSCTAFRLHQRNEKNTDFANRTCKALRKCASTRASCKSRDNARAIIAHAHRIRDANFRSCANADAVRLFAAQKFSHNATSLERIRARRAFEMTQMRVRRQSFRGGKNFRKKAFRNVARERNRSKTRESGASDSLPSRTVGRRATLVRASAHAIAEIIFARRTVDDARRIPARARARSTVFGKRARL